MGRLGRLRGRAAERFARAVEGTGPAHGMDRELRIVAALRRACRSAGPDADARARMKAAVLARLPSFG